MPRAPAAHSVAVIIFFRASYSGSSSFRMSTLSLLMAALFRGWFLAHLRASMIWIKDLTRTTH